MWLIGVRRESSFLGGRCQGPMQLLTWRVGSKRTALAAAGAAGAHRPGDRTDPDGGSR